MSPTRRAHRTKPFTFLLLLLAFALFAAACGGSGGDGESSESDDSTTERPEPSDTATLRVAVGADTGGTDPVNPNAGPPSNPIRQNTVEMLFKAQDGEIVPNLAESYELSADKLTYTIKLKPDITFQDGTPFNAEAVKWSYDRTKDPSFTGVSVGFMKSVASTEVVDDLTVEVKVAKPTPDLPGVLATMGAAILSPTGATTNGNTFLAYTHPIGTGPYSFVERVPDEKYVFERYEDYWGDKPYYKNLNWLIVPEAATRESMVLAGEADLAASPPLADIPALEANPDVKMETAPTSRMIGIILNTQDPLLSDVNVRKALNMAVDKDAIIDTVMAGVADKTGSPVASTINPTCEFDEPWDYDPDEAEKLLKAAGAEDLTLTLKTPKGRYVQDAEVAQVVANYLTEVGVNVKVEVLETAAWLAATNATKDKAGPVFALTGLVIPYPDSGRALLMYTPAGAPPNGVGSMFLEDPAVLASYAESNAIFENPERDEAFCETAELIWDEAPMIYLWNQRYPVVMGAEMEGVVVEFDEKINILSAYPQS